MQRKPTLLELRRHTSISAQQLAQEAGVALGQEYAVEIGGFASPAIAEKVMAAFRRLGQVSYTVNDIALNGTANHWQKARFHNSQEGELS